MDKVVDFLDDPEVIAEEVVVPEGSAFDGALLRDNGTIGAVLLDDDDRIGESAAGTVAHSAQAVLALTEK